MRNLKPWQKRLFVGLSLSIVTPSTLIFGSKVYSQSLLFFEVDNQKIKRQEVQDKITAKEKENQQLKLDIDKIKKQLKEVDEEAKLTANEINQKTQDEQQELESIEKGLDQKIQIVQEIPGLEEYTLEKYSLIFESLEKIAKENQDSGVVYRGFQRYFELRQIQNEQLQIKSEAKQKELERIAFKARSRGDNKNSSKYFTQSQGYYKIAQIFLKKSRFFLREAVMKREYKEIILLLQKQQQYENEIRRSNKKLKIFEDAKDGKVKKIEELRKSRETLNRQISTLEVEVKERQLTFFFERFLLTLCIACSFVLLLYIMQPNQLPYFIDEDMANNIVEQRNKALKKEKNKRLVWFIKRQYYKEAFLAVFTYHIKIRIDNIINSNKRQK